jgi:hypothetical protein
MTALLREAGVEICPICSRRQLQGDKNRPNSGPQVRPIQTDDSICEQKLVHNDEVCVRFRMGPPSRWMFWIVRLTRSRAASHLGLAFDVRFAVGRPARTTYGRAGAATHGTASIPEECAPPVFTSGFQRSACRAAAGRRILIGIRIEVLT